MSFLRRHGRGPLLFDPEMYLYVEILTNPDTKAPQYQMGFSVKAYFPDRQPEI